MRKLLGLFLCSGLAFAVSLGATGCGKDKKTTVSPTKDKTSPGGGKTTPTDGGTAEAKEKTHPGTFWAVDLKDANKFTMKDTDGKVHTHTLTADAKVWSKASKEIKLAEIAKGSEIKVTTKGDDADAVTKVEVTGDPVVVIDPLKDVVDKKDKDVVDKKDKDVVDKKDKDVIDKKDKDKDAKKDKDVKKDAPVKDEASSLFLLPQPYAMQAASLWRSSLIRFQLAYRLEELAL